MMKIVLFALVCVAITQVHGSELDDAIKKAIEKLDTLSKTTQQTVDYAKRSCDLMRSSMNMSSEYYLDKIKDAQTGATNAIKEVAKELTEKAKAGKNPEETIKCITKEEQATLSKISTMTSNVEAEVKKVKNDKISKVNGKEKEVKKIEDELPGRYKQGVADLKKCTDVSAVHHTLVKLEGEYTQVMLDCEELNEKIHLVSAEFDMLVRGETNKFERNVEKAKAEGVKKMNECMPKLARFLFSESVSN